MCIKWESPKSHSLSLNALNTLPNSIWSHLTTPLYYVFLGRTNSCEANWYQTIYSMLHWTRWRTFHTPVAQQTKSAPEGGWQVQHPPIILTVPPFVKKKRGQRQFKGNGSVCLHSRAASMLLKWSVCVFESWRHITSPSSSEGHRSFDAGKGLSWGKGEGVL